MKRSNNALNGSKFEHKIEKMLKKAKVSFLSQSTLKKTGMRLDILVKTDTDMMVNFSLKKSLRERYMQSAVENEHLKLNYKKCKTYIITEDEQSAINNTRANIQKSAFLKKNIKNVIHIDDLPDLIKTLNLVDINNKPRSIKRFTKRSNF